MNANSMPNKSFDVAIVGCGPAGSSAALQLARYGMKVAILEKGSMPRYKPCGGGIVYKALKYIPVDISSVIERRCFSVSLGMVSANKKFIIQRDLPLITMIMRDRFDLLLAKAAINAKVMLLENCKLTDIRSGKRPVLVTSRGDIKADFIIGADGAISTVARKAGWKETRRLVPSVNWEIFVHDKDLEKFDDIARFDFGLFSGGYAWLFPKKDHLSIGVLKTRSNRFLPDALIKGYLKFLGIKRVLHMKRYPYPIPISPRRDGFVKNKVLLVGDAAGFVDPITGEGISGAVLSGRLAAKAIIGGRFDEKRVKEIYESSIKGMILSEFRIGRFLAGLTYRYPKIRDFLFRTYGQKLAEALADTAMGRTYRRLVLSPFTPLKIILYLVQSGIGKMK